MCAQTTTVTTVSRIMINISHATPENIGTKHTVQTEAGRDFVVVLSCLAWLYLVVP